MTEAEELREHLDNAKPLLLATTVRVVIQLWEQWVKIQHQWWGNNCRGNWRVSTPCWEAEYDTWEEARDKFIEINTSWCAAQHPEELGGAV